VAFLSQEINMQAYSDPSREADPHALPDLEIFQLTAEEVAGRDEELIYEYSKRREFRLAFMNSRNRQRMLDAIIAEEGITGGWFYWYCFPGCMPDSDPIGPFGSSAEALNDAQDNAAD
jgi:hypothetical protein